MKLIDQAHLQDLSLRAMASPRRRDNWNLHPTLDDPIQRFCNAIEPGTYVRPHHHTLEGRWELFLALAGAAAVVVFDDGGVLRERAVVRAGGPTHGVEIPAGAWHTIAALEAHTVLFEIKPGPYSALTDKDFAQWAPLEGDPACPAFEQWFREGAPGRAPGQG
jgi:cupin fold WbuC family metalloprotein